MNLDSEFFYCILPLSIKLSLADIEAVTEATDVMTRYSNSDSVHCFKLCFRAELYFQLGSCCMSLAGLELNM